MLSSSGQRNNTSYMTLCGCEGVSKLVSVPFIPVMRALFRPLRRDWRQPLCRQGWRTDRTDALSQP